MGDDDLSYKMSERSGASEMMEGGGVAAKLMAQMGYQAGTGLGKLLALLLELGSIVNTFWETIGW